MLEIRHGGFRVEHLINFASPKLRAESPLSGDCLSRLNARMTGMYGRKSAVENA
jgi:hypothetical protein